MPKLRHEYAWGRSCSNAAPLFVRGSDMVCNACGTSVKIVSLNGEKTILRKEYQDVVTDLTEPKYTYAVLFGF